MLKTAMEGRFGQGCVGRCALSPASILPCDCPAAPGSQQSGDKIWAHLRLITGARRPVNLSRVSVPVVSVLSHLPKSQITKDSTCMQLRSFIRVTNVY